MSPELAAAVERAMTRFAHPSPALARLLDQATAGHDLTPDEDEDLTLLLTLTCERARPTLNPKERNYP